LYFIAVVVVACFISILLYKDEKNKSKQFDEESIQRKQRKRSEQDGCRCQ
jgi:hypothetical protein